MVDETRARLEGLAKSGDYKAMLRNLIAQGLLTLMETNVQVQCRQEDESLVRAVIPEAVAEYKKKMHIDVAVELDSKNYLPAGPSKVAAGAEFWYADRSLT